MLGWLFDDNNNKNNIHQYESFFDAEIIRTYLYRNSEPQIPTKHVKINGPEGPHDPKNNDDYVETSTPVYRRGLKPTPKLQEGLRSPTTVYGRKYSAHAVERMQQRWYTPSVVENTIKHGIQSKDPDPRNLRFYDKVNNIGVVIDKASELVITIRDGAFT